MKYFQTLFRRTVAVSLAVSVSASLYGWGFWGHKKSNEFAVFTLPPEMMGFYKQNLRYIVDHAASADKKRFYDSKEAPRHFIDLDHYPVSATSLPYDYRKAVEKYGEDSLDARGVLPWSVMQQYYELVKAFKDLDKSSILYHSTFLAHYVADAHVPLHTTANYNGQLTGQEGVHAFWESRIPELFGDNYHLLTGKAREIKDPAKYIRDIIAQSHAEVDSVLRIERELMLKYTPDRQFSIERKGRKLKKVYSEGFAEAYQQQMHGMEERRLKSGIADIGSFWYTAWIQAGKPDLSKVSEGRDPEDIFKSGKKLKKVRGHED